MTPLSAPTRRALELLATSPDYGWTVSFLAANDVSGKLIFNIREGLAVAKTEGVSPVEVTYITLTDTGRSSLGQGCATRRPVPALLWLALIIREGDTHDGRVLDFLERHIAE